MGVTITVHEWARRYTSVGLSVIPVRCDGSKAPAFADWRQYTDRIPNEQELAGWFGGDREYGIGVVPGPASGNLCVLDFECRNGYDVYAEWLAGLDSASLKIMESCPVVVTPSGGRHVWVRSETPQRGGVLARDENGLILIEIRGVGHQVLAPGCPEKCHKSGRAYTFSQRGWLPSWE